MKQGIALEDVIQFSKLKLKDVSCTFLEMKKLKSKYLAKNIKYLIYSLDIFKTFQGTIKVGPITHIVLLMQSTERSMHMYTVNIVHLAPAKS